MYLKSMSGSKRTGVVDGKIRRRIGALVIIVALHLAPAALLLRRQPPVVAPAVFAAMTVAAVPAPRAPPPPVEVSLPFDAHLAAPGFEIAAPAAATSRVCDVLTELRVALASDAAVATTLSAAVTGQRAVMAWNGGWSDVAQTDPMHRIIVAVLTAAPTSCLDEVLIGPRLIFVPAGSLVIPVAFGSGSWSWQMLIADT